MARARQFSVSGQDSEDAMDVLNARTRRGNTDVGLAGLGERLQKCLSRPKRQTAPSNISTVLAPNHAQKTTETKKHAETGTTLR